MMTHTADFLVVKKLGEEGGILSVSVRDCCLCHNAVWVMMPNSLDKSVLV